MPHITIGNWRRRHLQVILWNPFDPEDREHIGFGYGRWPRGETLAAVLKHGWTNYGFHGLVLGIIEFRYWPDQRLMRSPLKDAGVINASGT